MAKCSNCGKEVPQTEGKRLKLYCDDACRMKLKRRVNHKIKPLITNINTEQTITEQALPPDDELFAGLPVQLRIYANSEQGGVWYREQIRDIKITPLDKLYELKVASQPFIPCWRHAMEGFND